MCGTSQQAGVGKSVAVFVVDRAMQQEARTLTKRANVNADGLHGLSRKKTSKIKSHLEGMIVTAVVVQDALRAALEGAEADKAALRAELKGAERALAGAEAQLDKLRREAQEAGACCSFVICCIVVDWPLGRPG
jgi:hypothetical protein